MAPSLARCAFDATNWTSVPPATVRTPDSSNLSRQRGELLSVTTAVYTSKLIAWTLCSGGR